MREGIYWRGNNRAQHQQEECNPNQSFALPSAEHQAERRSANYVIVGCLILLCFVTWVLSRLQIPSRIPIESLNHQGPARAIVFELFRYHRHPQSGNRSFTGPVHRRRRGLLEYSETRASTSQGICSEEEQAQQPFEEDFNSLKRRSPKASVSSLATIGECPLFGGARASDLEIESFFVKVALGYGSQMHEYIMNVDTGSGSTWVNCLGKGEIDEMGPNGLFRPRRESFLNCKHDQDFCEDFQDGVEQPCDKRHKYRCLFSYRYGDDTVVQGSIVMGDVSFKLSDGSQMHSQNMAFGCAWTVTLEGEDASEFQKLISYDGLLGLGPYPGSWLLQLNRLRIISEYVVAICLEPEIGHLSSGPRSSVLEHVGFLSLGDSYRRQAAKIAWTATIPKSSDSCDASCAQGGFLPFSDVGWIQV
ncbi:hypothetical protein KC19_9G093100 [Ceratodon purpureus]|uniref:Peptidase A1 domain-containing protein n=1 Tax=Ceratodon purpureus TaxID=3225 RepID=A0A8T0GQD0_CERPU|nr:hypothetical protein KC19_9G093100 [Ceratodon purpureus]